MGKTKKDKKVKKRIQRAQNVVLRVCKTKTSTFWHPHPYDKKGRFIPSTVDCLFNQDYYDRDEAANMVRSL